MRNLKKIVAVLLAVALLASMMVTALAAVTNTDKALKLQSIGLMAGTEADLKLEEGLNRIQGLTFAIRAAGKEAEALAMTADEVAAQLAGYTDAKDIPDWNGNGPKYVAYAIKNQITVGVGNNKFAPLAPISGPSFLVFLLKSSMGYTEATTATSLVDLVVDAGILTPGQAVAIYNNNSLIRDDAAGILFAAVSTGVNKDGTKLIASLIKSGAVTEAKAVAAGFATATPTALEVVSATGANLAELVVKFNMAVDSTKVVKENFTVGGANASAVALSADKTEVTVSIAAPASVNGTEYKLVVKKAVGLAADVEKTVRVIDNTLPAVTGVTLVGPNKFEITFSEPMKTAGTVLLNNGIYSAVTSFTAGSNKATVTIPDLAAGNYDVKVKGFVDYAGFTMLEEVKTLTFVKDTTALTATISDVQQNKLTVKFNKELGMTPDVNYFYHTFSAWKPTAVTGSGASWTLDFTQYPIPEGNFNLVVKAVVGSTKVADLWGNVLASDLTIAGSVTADKVAPTVALSSVDTEQQITVVYSEAVNVTAASLKDNYVVKDKDGKDVTLAGFTATAGADNKYVVDFGTKLAGGNYTLVISNIEDTALAPNKMPASTIAFSITDLTPPSVTTAQFIEGSQLVYITYNEAMNASATDVNNYQVNTGATLVKPKTVTLFGDNKYKLEFETSKVTFAAAGVKNIVIGQVADAAGNKIVSLSTPIPAMAAVSAPAISSAKLVATNKIEIVIDAVIPSISADNVFVTETDGATTTASVAMVSLATKDGKTTITATLKADISAYLTSSDMPDSVSIAGGALVADTGVKEASTTTYSSITDGIAATYASITKSATTATITFDETLATTNQALYAFDLVVTDKDGNVLVAGVDYTTTASAANIQITFASAPTGKVTVATKASVTYITGADLNKVNPFTAKELTY